MECRGRPLVLQTFDLDTYEHFGCKHGRDTRQHSVRDVRTSEISQ